MIWRRSTSASMGMKPSCALLVGLAKDRAFLQVGVHFVPQEIVVLGNMACNVIGVKDSGVWNYYHN